MLSNDKLLVPVSTIESIQPALDDLARQRKRIQQAYESELYTIQEAEAKIKEIDKKAAAIKDGISNAAAAQAERLRFFTTLEEAQSLIDILPEWMLDDDPGVVNDLLLRLLKRAAVAPDKTITITLRD